MDTTQSGSFSGSRPWRIRRPLRPGSEEAAGRELAFPVVASLAVPPREVPVGVDGLEPGVVDGATVAVAPAWEEVGVEARRAAAVVAAEAHPVVVAGADATVVSQSAE